MEASNVSYRKFIVMIINHKNNQSEIKKNVQGTNSDGKETGTQINDLEQKEEINI